MQKGLKSVGNFEEGMRFKFKFIILIFNCLIGPFGHEKRFLIINKLLRG